MYEYGKYYEILEILENASPTEVKAAYRRLAIKWHPDKNRGNETVADRTFKKVLEAYEILSDPQERAKYDNWLSHSSSYTSFSDVQLDMHAFNIKCKAQSAISNALKPLDIWWRVAEELGSEYLGLFGGCEHKNSGDYSFHIFVCLHYGQVEEFKNRTLLVIDKYVKELNRLKEEAIREIENYSTNKLKNPNFKEAFEKFGWGENESYGWKNYIRKSGAKVELVVREKDCKQLIDDLIKDAEERKNKINDVINQAKRDWQQKQQNENSRRQTKRQQQNPQGDHSGSSSPDNPSNNSNQNKPILLLFPPQTPNNTDTKNSKEKSPNQPIAIITIFGIFLVTFLIIILAVKKRKKK